MANRNDMFVRFLGVERYVDDALTNYIPAHRTDFRTGDTRIPSSVYSNGVAGVGATLTGATNGAGLSGQGWGTPAVGKTVLVQNEINRANNGVYVISALGDSTHPFVLTRLPGADTATKLFDTIVLCLNDETLWYVTPSGTPATIGTSLLLSFGLNAAAGISTGFGLKLTGNALEIDFDQLLLDIILQSEVVKAVVSTGTMNVDWSTADEILVPTAGLAAVDKHAVNAEWMNLNFGNVGTVAAGKLLGNSATAAGTATPITPNPSQFTLGTDGTLSMSTGPIINATTAAPFVINGNTGVAVAGLSGCVFNLVGADGVAGNMTFTGYGAQPNFVGRRAGGTKGIPTGVTASANLMLFGATGYGATGFSTGARASMVMMSSEAWTDAAQGTQINFNTTKNGGTVTTQVMRIQNSGVVNIGTVLTEVASGGSLQVRGGALLDFINLGTATGIQVIPVAAAPTGTVAVATLAIRSNGSVGANMYFANAGGSFVAMASI